MKYTELYTFKITNIQKQTLQVLHKKYKINTSQFIRDAIKEKIERDNKLILKSYKELQEYLNTINETPF